MEFFLNWWFFILPVLAYLVFATGFALDQLDLRWYPAEEHWQIVVSSVIALAFLVIGYGIYVFFFGG